MTIDLEKLRALIDLLGEKDIAEFEHADDATRIKIVRTRAAQPAPVAALSTHAAGASPGRGGAAAEPTELPGDFADVTSPFVGTFYRSPSPDAPSFVEVGSVVKAGQTLCIIEAMKLMNEIESECAGTVVEIFAQNGKAVEFGQKLFRVRKA